MVTAANKPRKPARGPSKAELMAQQVQEAIRPGQSVELLKELHILTRDGALNQDSRRKLKQVYHLFGFIEKILLELEAAGNSAITLADHGAGKSYLGSSSTTCSSSSARAARFTASRRARSWCSARVRWRSSSVLRVCAFCH